VTEWAQNTSGQRFLMLGGFLMPNVRETPSRIGGSNKLISAKEVAVLLGFHEDTVYRDWRKWGLNGFHVGRQLRFRQRDIDAWIEQKAA
jgi:excisionase family DNA binding protein